MPFEMVKQPLHFYPDQSAAPQWLRDAHDKILAADGFLVISAEYNCTIPPALTNMMDHFSPASYANKPCAIATYSVCKCLPSSHLLSPHILHVRMMTSSNKTFSALLALCEGNPPITSGFPSQRPVTRVFDVFFDLRLNKRLSNNRDHGNLRRYRVHYDVNVMSMSRQANITTYSACKYLIISHLSCCQQARCHRYIFRV